MRFLSNDHVTVTCKQITEKKIKIVQKFDKQPRIII